MCVHLDRYIYKKILTIAQPPVIKVQKVSSLLLKFTGASFFFFPPFCGAILYTESQIEVNFLFTLATYE